MPKDNNNGTVSSEAFQVAKALDRLPPGEYIVHLSKQVARDGGWRAKIVRSETVREVGRGNKQRD